MVRQKNSTVSLKLHYDHTQIPTVGLSTSLLSFWLVTSLLGHSPTELPYGLLLSLPGQMLAHVDLSTQGPASYAHRL